MNKITILNFVVIVGVFLPGIQGLGFEYNSTFSLGKGDPPASCSDNTLTVASSCCPGSKQTCCPAVSADNIGNCAKLKDITANLEPIVVGLLNIVLNDITFLPGFCGQPTGADCSNSGGLKCVNILIADGDKVTNGGSTCCKSGNTSKGSPVSCDSLGCSGTRKEIQVKGTRKQICCSSTCYTS